MSPTPRTDESRRTDNGETGPLLDKMEVLETELAAAKEECERLINQRDNLLKPLRARAEDRADAADEKVERLTSENEKLTIERDALANGSATELARLRAEVERLKGALALGQENCDFIYNDMRKERTELTARAERAEAECVQLRAAMKP